MADAEDILRQGFGPLWQQLQELRRMLDGLERRKQARVLLEQMRNARQQNPELDRRLNDRDPSAQWGGIEQELQQLQDETNRLQEDNARRAEEIQRQQEELRRREETNLDRDGDRVPDDVENRREAEEANRRRDEQAAEDEQDRDQDGDGVDDAVEDREREQAERDREAEARKEEERQREREEQERTDRGADAAVPAAAGAAAAADGLDDERDRELNEPEAEQVRQDELDGPEAEQEPEADRVRQQGLDGPEGEQVRQEELDGPEGEQGPELGDDGVDRPVGEQVGQEPEAEQTGQDVDADGAVPAGIGADQQQNQQGERPRDPLEDRLDQDRAQNQSGRMSVTADSINGVDTRGQQLPEGVYEGSATNLRVERTGAGNDERGEEASTGEDGGRPDIQFAGGTVDGVQLPNDRSVNLEEFERLRAQQTATAPAAGATNRTEGAAVATAHGGRTPGQQHREVTSSQGAGRESDSGGREPRGRG